MTRLVPAREQERLVALHKLHIVGMEHEIDFNRFCRQARRLFDMPIAYIAFIDEARQWVKASSGLELSSSPRADTFCARTILLDRVLIIRDALEDARFAENPHVLGQPFIRFYAGAPLAITQGLHVGTLCLIDTVARDFLAAQAEALRGLAECVVGKLEDRASRYDGALSGLPTAAQADRSMPPFSAP